MRRAAAMRRYAGTLSLLVVVVGAIVLVRNSLKEPTAFAAIIVLPQRATWDDDRAAILGDPTLNNAILKKLGHEPAATDATQRREIVGSRLTIKKFSGMTLYYTLSYRDESNPEEAKRILETFGTGWNARVPRIEPAAHIKPVPYIEHVPFPEANRFLFIAVKIAAALTCLIMLTYLPQLAKWVWARRKKGPPALLPGLMLVNLACDRDHRDAAISPPKAGPTSSVSQIARNLKFDFGIVEPGQKKEHEFPIHNDSGQRWTFQGFETNCVCTVSKASRPHIEPGQTETVLVSYKAPTSQNDDRRVVGVTFREPETPSVNLSISAKIRNRISVMPETVLFPKMRNGRESNSFFEVYNYGTMPVKITGIKSGLEWIHASVKSVKIEDFESV